MSKPSHPDREDFLDRPIPEDYRVEWTRHLATPEEVSRKETVSALVFRLNEEWYALSTSSFKETIREAWYHQLPHRRPGSYATGFLVVRGEMITCISLELALGLPQRLRPVKNRLLQVLRMSCDAGEFAFPVTEAAGVVGYQQKELQSPPPTLVHAKPHFTKHLLSWRNQTVAMLDESLLIYEIQKNFS